MACDGMGDHGMGDVTGKIICTSMANDWIKNPKRKDCEEKVIDICSQTPVVIDKRANKLHHGSLWILCFFVLTEYIPDILTDGLQDHRELDSVVDMVKFMCEKFSDDN